MDILLDVSDLNSGQALVLNKDNTRLRIDQPENNIVLESWHLDLLPPTPTSVAASSSLELPLVYKQGILLFRALAAATRAFPAYKLGRQLKKGKHGLPSGLRLGCRLSQQNEEPDVSGQRGEYGLRDKLSSTGHTDAVDSFDFAPVSTPSGNIVICVEYRRHVDFGVEDKEALLSSRFLNEDFFKPSIKSGSSFPSSAPSSHPHSFEHRQSSSFGSRYQPSPLSTGVSAQPSTSKIGPESGSSNSAELQDSSRKPSADEGAFILSRRSSASSMKGRGMPLSTSYKRQSIASQLQKNASPSSSLSGTGPGVAATSPQPVPYSSSPNPSASHRAVSFSSGYGPSSSLRYTTLNRTSDYSDSSPQGGPSSLSSSRGVVIPRYSSHRYARSNSSTGSGESAPLPPLSASPAFGPESLGRRSRMGSYFRETHKLSGTPEDSDEINSFLQLIDSRPQLKVTQGVQKSASTLASEADERLRVLAGSLACLPVTEEEEPSRRRMSDAPLPSSFPRYVQQQERRATKVQTGFFTQSSSTSPSVQSSAPFPSLSRYPSSPAPAQNEEVPSSPTFVDDDCPVGRLDMSEERPSNRRSFGDQRPVEGINIHRGGRSKTVSRDRGESSSQRTAFGAALKRVNSNSSSSSSSMTSNV